MVTKIKYGKIAVVVFLTILVWVWADLAKTEQYIVSGARIKAAKSVNPSVWVSFNNEPSFSIEKIVLKGSASKIADARREIENGTLDFEFFLDPEQEEAIAEPGEYTWDVLGFLKSSRRIRQRGLTVESCEPQRISIRVAKLERKLLTVRCVDKENNLVKTLAIDPPQVPMFVPGDWERERLVANIQLTDAEIEQSRYSPVSKAPFIEISPGQPRKALTIVQISTHPEQERRRDELVTAVKFGFTLSPNLQGKYVVAVTNPDAVMGAVTIRATPEAKRAYENMRYQVILEIDDEDVKSDSPRRELVYNFPAEYVAKDEIELKQQPVVARFKLMALTAEPE